MKYANYTAKDLREMAEVVDVLNRLTDDKFTYGSRVRIDSLGDIHLELDGEETPFTLILDDDRTYSLSLVVPL